MFFASSIAKRTSVSVVAAVRITVADKRFIKWLLVNSRKAEQLNKKLKVVTVVVVEKSNS